MIFRWLFLFFLAMAGMVCGCGDKAGHVTMSAPVGTVVAKPRPRVAFEELREASGQPLEVHVVIARTAEETKRGLMFVDKLEDGRGMLFMMPQQRVQTFWMKNTYIPLDMIFIDDAKKVVGVVENAEPLTLEPRYVNRPSRYVLEVPGGWSRRVGVKEGLSVRFVDVSG